MALPERSGGERPAEAATAPQPLPSGPDSGPPPPESAKATAPQPLPSRPDSGSDSAPDSGPSSPESAKATAPQRIPERPQEARQSPPPGPAKVTAPQAVPPEPPAPRPPSDQPTQSGQPAQSGQSGQPAQHAPVAPAAVPFPFPGAPGARRPAGFHRFHFPIGIFLVAYGVTALVFSFLGWDAHLREMSDYLGEGVAAPALIAVKVVQVLLVLVTLAGLLRRRDVWFLPALCGWAAGFAVFCVLDGVKGRMADLVEHGAYLVAFAFLLCLSYALGVKARVAARRAASGEDADGPGDGGPGQLSRTQEIALAALERWQRQFQQPGPVPPQPGPPQPHGAYQQAPPGQR